jgi:hypothetical protein
MEKHVYVGVCTPLNAVGLKNKDAISIFSGE